MYHRPLFTPLAAMAAFAVLTAVLSGPVRAAQAAQAAQAFQDTAAQPQRTHAARPASDGFDHGMQPVRHDATPQERAHGWRYYSDPSTQRAVVISPQGDYYYSRGKGLHWVAAEQV